MIYENTYIGSFIYSLGLYAGRFGSHENDSINLLQQTPHDRDLSDLLTHWQGRSFLIEFKKDIKGFGSERSKTFYKDLIKHISKDKEMQQLSEKCHYFSYGDKKEHLVFMEYLALAKSNYSTWPKNDFIKNLHRGRDIGLPLDLFEKYYLFLGSLRESGGKKKKPVAGLIVNVTEDGYLNFLPFSNYFDLSQSLTTTLTLTSSKEKNIEFKTLKKGKKTSLGM